MLYPLDGYNPIDFCCKNNTRSDLFNGLFLKHV